MFAFNCSCVLPSTRPRGHAQESFQGFDERKMLALASATPVQVDALKEIAKSPEAKAIYHAYAARCAAAEAMRDALFRAGVQDKCLTELASAALAQRAATTCSIFRAVQVLTTKKLMPGEARGSMCFEARRNAVGVPAPLLRMLEAEIKNANIDVETEAGSTAAAPSVAA